jgi:tetratricopeptide (TPR) repeat protein
MQAVAAQAQAYSDRGLAMAQRGMLFAARNELTKALQLLAQARDVQQGGSVHTSALAAGLTALEEARDFSVPDGRPAAVVDVAAVASTHRTPLLKTTSAAGELSPVVAQQHYFGLAQAQLVIAAGGQPVASQALYRLGRLQSALAVGDAAPQALHGPQAMVFHQAALAIDGNNHLAANELGVLLARYGQLENARLLLQHSVQIKPEVESWHNLAVVHRRLGEIELARQADRQRELLAQKAGGRSGSAGDLVRWVDPQTFAASAGKEAARPANTAAKPPASPSGQRR